MQEIIKQLERITDPRQAHKTKHKLMDIVIIVLLSMLGNADTWEEIEMFATTNENLLKKYIGLANGIPSHDTIQRVMSVIHPETMGQIQSSWNDMLSRGEGETLKQIIT